MLVARLIVCAVSHLGAQASPPPKSIFNVPEGQGSILALDVQTAASRQLRVLTDKAVFRVKLGDPLDAEVVTLKPEVKGGVAGFILAETPAHRVRYAFANVPGRPSGASLVASYDGAGNLIRITKVPYSGTRFDVVRLAWIGEGEHEPRMLVMSTGEREWYLVGLVSGEITKVDVGKVLGENNVHFVRLKSGQGVVVASCGGKVVSIGLDGRVLGEVSVKHPWDDLPNLIVTPGSRSLERLVRCDDMFCVSDWVEEGSPFNKLSLVRINDAGAPELVAAKLEPPVNPGVLCVREGNPCVFMVTEFLDDPENGHVGRRIRVQRDGVEAVEILDRRDEMGTQVANFEWRPAQYADSAVYLASLTKVFRIPLAPDK